MYDKDIDREPDFFDVEDNEFDEDEEEDEEINDEKDDEEE